jgi:hypothetical protein
MRLPAPGWLEPIQYREPSTLSMAAASHRLPGEGTPTVILESGVGDDWLMWQAVQPELSKVSRVCSYDHLGLG